MKEEDRETVQRIANLYANREVEDAKELAREQGWSRIGAGKGRAVWVVTDKNPGADDPTRGAPCVVKFAKGKHGRAAGTLQNREEVNQWLQFPDRVQDAEPPVVVPIKDWDDVHHRWLSMPMADSSERVHGGRVVDRLFKLGWECDDLHGDNIGKMHDAAVILDYGFTCHEVDGAGELAEALEASLDGEPWAANVESHGGRDHSTTEWVDTGFGSLDVLPGGSAATVDREGFVGLTLRFGRWPDEQHDEIQLVAENVGDAIEKDWGQVEVRPRAETPTGEGVEILMEVDVHAMGRRDRWEETVTRDFIEDVRVELEDELNRERVTPEQYAKDVIRELRDVSAFTTDATYSAGGSFAQIRFGPSTADPGFPVSDPPRSDIEIGTQGFEAMQAVFGPWREDEPNERLLPDAAEEVMLAVDAEFENMGVSYRVFDVVGQPGTFVRISATFLDDPDVDPLEPVAVADLYDAILSNVRDTFPRARREGEPVQQEIDEFIEQRLGF